MYNYKIDIVIQAVKIYNGSYTKRRENKGDCLKKYYKLTVSEDRIKIEWIDTGLKLPSVKVLRDIVLSQLNQWNGYI